MIITWAVNEGAKKGETNDIAILCHMTNFQQLTAGHGKRQSVDLKNS